MSLLPKTSYNRVKKPATAMSNGSSMTPSSTSVKIIPFPSLEEIVLTGWEDLRKMNLKEEMTPEVEANKEKIIVKDKEEKQKEEQQEVNSDEYPPNPYQFNI
jgi:hypothetical protein